MKNPFRPTWRTVGYKVMGDGSHLRMQLHEVLKTTRVQRSFRSWWLGSIWQTLPPDLGQLEALMFNCPTRLAIRLGTDQTIEVCTNNVLLSHYAYLPLTHPKHKMYIVSKYADVSTNNGGMYYDEDKESWRPIDDFFNFSSLSKASHN